MNNGYINYINGIKIIKMNRQINFFSKGKSCEADS